MGNEKLGRLVAYAEILSAFVIVITLIYAVTEYRRGQVVSDSEINKMLHEISNDYNMASLSNSELIDARMAILEGRELTPRERYIFTATQNIMLNGWELAFDNARNGIITEKTWRLWDIYCAYELANDPPWVWEALKVEYSLSSFGDHADQSIKKYRDQ